MVLFFKTILTKEFPYFLFFVTYVLLHNIQIIFLISEFL